jgi:hypothetical protein
MQGYINPQLVALLAAQQGRLPVAPPQATTTAPAAPNMPAAVDLPAAAPLVQPQADSVNDGINSVGRPSDADPAKAAAHDKALKKLQRQGKGEALMALGAQLLSSRTFGEGLSKGMLAYVQSMNAARTRNTPKHEDVADGAYDKVTDPVDDSVSFQRTPVADYKDKQLQLARDGKLAVANVGYDGKVDAAQIAREGGMDRTVYSTDAKTSTADADRKSRENVARWHNDTMKTVAEIAGKWRQQNRAPTKAEMAILDSAQSAGNELQTMDAIEGLLDAGDTGAGAGLGQRALRATAAATGINMGGVNVDHMQQLNAYVSQIKAKASLMKGQGQISNYERQIMNDALPSLDTNPDSIRKVLGVMRAKAERDAKGLGVDANGNTYSLLDATHGLHSSSTPAPSSQSTSTGVSWRVVH